MGRKFKFNADKFDYSDIQYGSEIINNSDLYGGGNKKKKRKKKKNRDNEYDYSDIHYRGDIRKVMNAIADSLEDYINYIEVYIIFEGITEDDWIKNMKIAKKLIKKLRQGNPDVFDIPSLNELLDSGHDLIIGG